jgi:hypothetical protein
MTTVRTIYKYPLDMGGNDLLLPAGAELLDVQFQFDAQAPVLWAIVDADHDPGSLYESWHVDIVGTGFTLGDVHDKAHHVSTFQVAGLVLHAFAWKLGGAK